MSPAHRHEAYGTNFNGGVNTKGGVPEGTPPSEKQSPR